MHGLFLLINCCYIQICYLNLYTHIFVITICNSVCVFLMGMFSGPIILYWIAKCFDKIYPFFPTPLEYLPATVPPKFMCFVLNPPSLLSAFCRHGLEPSAGLNSSFGNTFLEKTDSHSISSHQLPTAFRLMVATHEHSLLPCWGCGRIDLT